MEKLSHFMCMAEFQKNTYIIHLLMSISAVKGKLEILPHEEKQESGIRSEEW